MKNIRRLENTEIFIVLIGIVLTFGASDVFKSKVSFLDTAWGRYLMLTFAVVLFVFSNYVANKVFKNRESLANRYLDKLIDRIAMILFFYVLTLWLQPIFVMYPVGSFFFGVFLIVISNRFAQTIFG